MMLFGELIEIRDMAIEARTKSNIATEKLERLKKDVTKKKANIKRIEEAIAIVQEVSKEIHSSIESKISDIVNYAMSKYKDKYEFVIETVSKRNKSEADIFLIRGNKRLKATKETGGSIGDVIAFSIRIAIWGMDPNRKRATLIFDEPFKFLDKDSKDFICEFIKEISEKLEVQIIMTALDIELQSDSPLASIADNIIYSDKG